MLLNAITVTACSDESGVGVLLAFGAHYLDPHLRTRSDAEQLGLTVLGQIPRHNGQ